MLSIRVLLALVSLSAYGCSAGQLYDHTHPDTIPDDYIVVAKAGVSADVVDELQTAIRLVDGVTVERVVRVGRRNFIMIKGPLEKVRAVTTLQGVDFVESNQRTGLVESVESGTVGRKDAGVEAQAAAHPICHEDPTTGEDSWGLIRTTYHARPDYQTERYMWGEGDDGAGVDIYVLDTGIDLGHDDFEGRAIWGFTGEQITNPAEEDVHGHGTHVAGTCGGSMYGVARKATLVACKVLDDDGFGDFSDVILALEYVVERVRQQRQQGQTPRAVINMALALPGPAYAGEKAIQAAHDEGVLSVVAAGSGNIDTCLLSPARMGAVMAVAASDMDDKMAPFTNYGPCTDMIAPGVLITGTEANSNGGYVKKNGTSMAAAHVTGVVARHLSVLTDQEAAGLSANMLKARVLDQGSRGHVALETPEHMASPDRLLYKVCEAPHEVPVDDTTTTTTTTTTPAPPTTSSTTPQPTEPSDTVKTGKNELFNLSVASLVLTCVVLCGSIDAIIIMYCAISKKKNN